MKVDGSYTFSASREVVWAKLLDPKVLAACIPGCRELSALGPDRYSVVLTVGVGAITGAYTGEVALTDLDRPNSFKMLVQGKGAGGAIRGEALVRLGERDGKTEVTVEGDSQVSGLLARVGQRLLGGVSKMLLGQFFEGLKANIEGG